MMPAWPRPGRHAGWGAGPAGGTEVTPSLSLEAWRPGLFPLARSLVVLRALSPGGPPPQPAPPCAWGVAALGTTLQEGLWGCPLRPGTHSRSLSCLLGGSTTSAGCPWVSAFPRRQKVPVSLFEPRPLVSILPAPSGSCAGRNPRSPCSGSAGSHGASWNPGCPQWGARPGPPHEHAQSTTSLPGPSTKLSRHYPAPPGPVTAWGAGDALGEAPAPTSSTLLRGQPPAPHRVTPGERWLLLPLPGAWRLSGAPRPL